MFEIYQKIKESPHPHISIKVGCFHDSNNYKHFLHSLLTLDHVVLGDTLSPGHPVGGDVLDPLLEHGPDPDAEVGRHNVHQPEPGEALELVNVQLKYCIRLLNCSVEIW